MPSTTEQQPGTVPGHRASSRTTLATGLAYDDNALNFLRLVLAATVIISHSLPLSGLGDDDVSLGRIGLGSLAVAGFFVISGYLIAGSAMRQPMRTFVFRRIMRIYPAYWLCTLVTAFGISAVIGARRGGWSASAALDFVLHSLLAPLQGTVGTTLEGAPNPTTVNGSLWTLPLEFLCYLMLAAAVSVPFVRRRLTAFSTGGLVALGLLGIVLGMTSGGEGLLVLMMFFGAGVVAWCWREAIPLDGRLAAAALVAWLTLVQFAPVSMLSAVPAAYVCLWFGARAPRILRPVGHRNDVSYGIYLYGWPVEQMLTALGAASLGLVAYAGLALGLATALAWCSWLLVERPANDYAKRSRGRGSRRTAAPA